MFNKKTVIVTAGLAVVLFVVSTGFAQSLEENWNDFLHYTKIGRFSLAAGYAQAVLDSNPDPVELLALSEANPQGYTILLKVVETGPDAKLVKLSDKILDIIEQGRFARRFDPKIITEQIKRLSGTSRGQLAAVKSLQNAGEYAIMYMLDAMADKSRQAELPNIIWALPQIGRDSIRPLAAALQTEDVAVKAEIIKALGQIGYPQSLAYLKYIVENDKSSELRTLAVRSIESIDPGALKLPAAQLFYQLAENYYYHAESLAPVENSDFANIWFWDAAERRLVREKVDGGYFYELMAMRACEWALKADAGFGWAIGLWQAAYFKAESTGAAIPAYFGPGHADAIVYARTAGPEYLHQALARAIADRDGYVALGVIEALATTAGEKSLFYRVGPGQPLLRALAFNNRAVKYSAAIAIAAAGPGQGFAESSLVAEILAQALGETAEQRNESTGLVNKWVTESYDVRAAKVMLELVQKRNTVIDLSVARNALIDTTKDKSRPEIQILAGRVLARLASPDAQRFIAEMALAETNEMAVRLSAFDSLIISAKLNANMLDDEKLNAIYSLISSQDTDPQLRSAAAAAFGSLNLPSQKVKDLILDQAKS